MPYKHLFFDLDHTLWDFHNNQITTLKQLFIRFQLDRFFNSFDDFFKQYMPINTNLWHEYQHGRIPKKEVKVGRFYQTFFNAGFDDMPTAESFADAFVSDNSLQTGIIPHTMEVLEYLKKKKYHLYIITNGFREAQHTKMEKSGLTPFFERTFISEDIGASKPNRKFFEYAIKSANARKAESLVIGDSLENDIKGARDFGVNQVYFNPEKAPHKEKVFREIASLKELMEWL
jgi:putative hydrolase of the HAD superfamily